MQFHFGPANNPNAQAPGPDPVVDLLRQMVEIQKEHLNQTRHLVAVQESNNGRWRAMVTRWKDEFPVMPEAAKASLPILEKAYGSILSSMVEELYDKGSDALDSEFAIQDFLDKYGMRIGQMSHILNIVSPLAELHNQTPTSPNESSGN